MKSKNTILLATRNKGKIYEILSLFSDLNIKILSLDDFPEIDDITESGETLLENSLIKSKEAYRITGLPSLADDSGLEVDLLNGAPGVYSARYAGENATYNENINKLLSKLVKYNNVDVRTARFKTVISYVSNKMELVEYGEVEGYITTSKLGSNGFGYDPIFKPKGFNLTFAEMNHLQKAKISHRSKALNKMKTRLIKVYEEKGVNIDK